MADASERWDVWGFVRPTSPVVVEETPPSSPTGGSPFFPSPPFPVLPPMPGPVVQMREEHRERARTSHEVRWSRYWRGLTERSGGSSPMELDPDDRELQQLVRGGIAVAFRGAVWSLLCAVPPQQVQLGKAYVALQHADADEAAADAERQIDLDIERTWPQHRRMDDEARLALRRVLVALSRAAPDVGYCQGLNHVAATFLLFAPEVDAFAMVRHVMRTVLPEGWYDQSLSASAAEARVTGELIARTDRPLAERMRAMGVEASMITTQWFLCMFVHCLPFDVALRVWDCVLLAGAARREGAECGADVLQRVALALLRLHRTALLKARHAGDFVRAAAEAVRSTDNAEALIRTAYRTSPVSNFPPPAELAELRRVHRAAVDLELARVLEQRERLRRERSADAAVGTGAAGGEAARDAPEGAAPRSGAPPPGVHQLTAPGERAARAEPAGTNWRHAISSLAGAFARANH